MAKPMTAQRFQTICTANGIPFEGYKNWAVHNRGDRGNGWSDVKGVMIHHTGSDSAEQKPFLRDGDSKLPGPLCQIHIDSLGKAWGIGWGRANHAGGGDPKILQLVISEDYVSLPKPTFHDGEKGATDGNGYFYGIEIGYSGNHGMTPNQYRTLIKICAQICKEHKWTHKSVIGHGEWSDWKWDPGYAPSTMMDMNRVREDIRVAITPPKTATKPAVKTVVVNKGDTIVFPGGGKVVVQ